MNTAELSILIAKGEVELSAAYVAMFGGAGNCILIRGFKDIVDLTQRIWVASELIKNVEDSEWKETICKVIEWKKEYITRKLMTSKAAIASEIAVNNSDKDHVSDYYKGIVKTIEGRDQYVTFYDWIKAIGRSEAV